MKSLAIKAGMTVLALFVLAFIVGQVFHIAKLAFTVAILAAVGYGAFRLFSSFRAK